MPDEDKKMVPIDTSGPDAEVDIEEVKDESVVETEAPEKETSKEEPIKQEEKKQDENLEDYSKGVQARIAKLTRKMREAERREQAAIEYAKGVEESRKKLESKFKKTDSDYIKKFETSIQAGLEAAQKELAVAIDAGDSKAQVEANKRIATLAFENAKLEQIKQSQEETIEEKPTKPSQVQNAPNVTQQTENPDPRAEAWASKNTWFGTDRAMTYTAFEIHKHLTEKEYHVIRLSFGINCDKLSAKQIAEKLNMKGSSSYVRVSQLKKQAIEKLKQVINHSQVVDYL